MNKQEFPQHLLFASKTERIEYFRNVFVMHDVLNTALDKIHCYISACAPEQIIIVCGPSGVGKKEIIRSLVDYYSTEKPDNFDVGCIPVVSVEAKPALLNGVFDIKAFSINALRSLREPMIQNKIGYETVTVYDELGRSYIVSKPKQVDFVDSLTSTLHNRKTRVFIVNEGQHMLRHANGKKTNTLVDVIKSIANLSKTVPLVLVGTYELLNLIDGLEIEKIDQMITRVRIVHLPRYNIDDENEGRMFGNIVLKMLRNMPFAKSPEYIMDKYWKELFLHTNGCVGALKNWLLDAYTFAIQSNSDTLLIKHLEETKTSLNLASTKLTSIQEGERRIARILSDETNISTYGTNTQSDGTSIENMRQTEKLMSSEESTMPQKPTKGKPGERKPHRDIVG